MATFFDRITQLYEEARDENYRVGRNAFAEQLGVSVGKVNGWLNRGGRPDVETLKQIARRKNVSTSWLVGETDCRSQQGSPSGYESLPEEARKECALFFEFLCYKYKKQENK